jgi:hypothetical protein
MAPSLRVTALSCVAVMAAKASLTSVRGRLREVLFNDSYVAWHPTDIESPLNVRPFFY